MSDGNALCAKSLWPEEFPIQKNGGDLEKEVEYWGAGKEDAINCRPLWGDVRAKVYAVKEIPMKVPR